MSWIKLSSAFNISRSPRANLILDLRTTSSRKSKWTEGYANWSFSSAARSSSVRRSAPAVSLKHFPCSLIIDSRSFSAVAPSPACCPAGPPSTTPAANATANPPSSIPPVKPPPPPSSSPPPSDSFSPFIFLPPLEPALTPVVDERRVGRISPCETRTCLANASVLENVLSHSGLWHANGFSPVWLRRWTSRAILLPCGLPCLGHPVHSQGHF